MRPKLSVCMVTYNHEKYIQQAIESVLMQKTDFYYELVIGEDCSTDKTKNIVIAYKKKYPRIVRMFINKINVGAGLNFIHTLKACKGEYIALLDGDDYWTDPYKLQKQVDFLNNHHAYTICSHNVYVTQDGSTELPIEWLGNTHRKTSTLEDILQYGSGGATCSLVFQKKSIFPLPKWYHSLPGGDWALQILSTTHGNMYYFNNVMGVYQRGHPNNALAIATQNARKKGSETIGLSYLNNLSIINTFDKYFNYRYTNLLKNQIIYCCHNLAIIYKQNNKFIEAKYFAWRCLKEIHSRTPYLSFKRIINLVKILLLFNKGNYELKK